MTKEEKYKLNLLVDSILQDQKAFNWFHDSHPKVEWVSIAELKEYIDSVTVKIGEA